MHPTVPCPRRSQIAPTRRTAQSIVTQRTGERCQRRERRERTERRECPAIPPIPNYVVHLSALDVCLSAARPIPRRPLPRSSRRRLRRHRHQPTLRIARVLPWHPRHRSDARERAWGPVLDLLGTHVAHLDQVPDLRDAGRQQGRGRHPGTDGAGFSAPGGTAPKPGQAYRARPVRRGSSVRRRHDYPGHFSAERCRGSHGRHPRLRTCTLWPSRS